VIGIYERADAHSPTPAPTNNLNNDDDSPTMMDEGRIGGGLLRPPSDKPQTATSQDEVARSVNPVLRLAPMLFAAPSDLQTRADRSPLPSMLWPNRHLRRG
jgi:hypothetical protein